LHALGASEAPFFMEAPALLKNFPLRGAKKGRPDLEAAFLFFCCA